MKTLGSLGLILFGCILDVAITATYTMYSVQTNSPQTTPNFLNERTVNKQEGSEAAASITNRRSNVSESPAKASIDPIASALSHRIEGLHSFSGAISKELEKPASSMRPEEFRSVVDNLLAQFPYDDAAFCRSMIYYHAGSLQNSENLPTSIGTCLPCCDGDSDRFTGFQVP